MPEDEAVKQMIEKIHFIPSLTAVYAWRKGNV
jgi:hypothetical protein